MAGGCAARKRQLQLKNLATNHFQSQIAHSTLTKRNSGFFRMFDQYRNLTWETRFSRKQSPKLFYIFTRGITFFSRNVKLEPPCISECTRKYARCLKAGHSVREGGRQDAVVVCSRRTFFEATRFRDTRRFQCRNPRNWAIIRNRRFPSWFPTTFQRSMHRGMFWRKWSNRFWDFRILVAQDGMRCGDRECTEKFY